MAGQANQSSKSGPFPRLFGSATVGNLKLRNRVVMLPMGIAYGTASGEVTQKTIDYYVARARGGVGLIIVGNISPYLHNGLNQLILDSDWVLMGHYELVEKVHEHGARIAAQLNHMGRENYIAGRQGETLVSSSALPATHLGEVFPTPRALSKTEIFQYIERYAGAAERTRRVGYDIVELHAAHGYLINQFMSPFMNNRTDEFGGSLENRMRFPLEVIKAVRRAVGPDFPVGIRISADEFVPGGITIRESPAIARMLEEAGVAYISVSAGMFETYHKQIGVMGDPEGWKDYLWEAIKRATGVPIIAGGGLRHPDFCEQLLEQGKADFIGLARPLLADPEWPKKAKEGRAGDIRFCISCNECLAGSAARRRGASRCAINPATGREAEFAASGRSPVRKRVIVVGGGPAGMEAARVAAGRGHSVTLYEKGKALGGQLLLAGRPGSRAKVLWLRDYLARQLEELGVAVKLGVEATPELIEKARPDVVVVATGAEPVTPDVPGMSNRNVVSAWDLLRAPAKSSNEKVVVVGGGMVGCDVAEYLLESGNNVTIVEQLASIAPGMERLHRFVMLELFSQKGVTVLTKRKLVGIKESGVEVVNLETGKNEVVKADRIVIAAGARPVDGLVASLEGVVPQLFTAGDCNRVRVIMEAVYEGSLAGRQV